MTKILLWTIIAIVIQFIDAAMTEDLDKFSAETEGILTCLETNIIVWTFENRNKNFMVISVLKPQLLRFSNPSSLKENVHKCFSAQILLSTYNLTIYEPPHYVRTMESLSRRPVEGMSPVNCRASGQPTTNINWFKDDKAFEQQRLGEFEPNVLTFKEVTADDKGYYECIVCNNHGCFDFIYWLDIEEESPNKPHIEDGYPKDVTGLVNSVVYFNCPVSFTSKTYIKWLYVNSSYGFKINEILSTELKGGDFFLKITGVNHGHEGWYVCIATNSHGSTTAKGYLSVKDYIPEESQNKPYIIDGYPKNVTALVNSTAYFMCPVVYDFKTYRKWLYVNTSNEFEIKVINSGEAQGGDLSLKITDVNHGHEGWYICVATNSLGNDTAIGYLSVKDYIPVDSPEPAQTTENETLTPVVVTIAVAITSTVILLFLFFCIYHVKRIRSEKLVSRRAMESAKAEITAFWIKKVVIEKIPDSSGDVVDPLLLPVVKIEKGIVEGSNHINQNGGYEFPIDLKWEIPREKILLGKKIGEGAFGIVCKAEAIGVLNPHTQCTVAVKMLKDDHSENYVKDLVSEMEILKTIGKHCNIVRLIGCCTQGGPLYVVVEYAPYGNLKDFLRQHRSYADTYATPISNPNEEKSTLTQRDLVSFAYQVAKGMEYLSSRRCIHRDLAARNILVSDNYILKITDFGLAKDIRTNDYYKKKTNGLLPIKWMAPEALFNNMYTIKSDVWSYGILLWEIMTFGGTPYPSISNPENLYDLILKGYRMYKPPECSLEIYALMCDCWCLEPNERPVFSKIVEDLGRILVTTRKHDYLDLVPPQPDNRNQELDCK